MSTEQEFTSTIVKFVNFALNQKERTGICDILGEIANATNSYGAILWEPDPYISLDNKYARLFTAGHWFESGKPFAAHDLSSHRSLAGRAIAEDKLIFTNDILNDKYTAKTKETRQFYAEQGVVKCQAAPVHFADKDKSVGCIALLRTSEQADFAEQNPLLGQLCQLLPGLHDSLHNKVSLGLINEVKDILRYAEDDDEEQNTVWITLCKAIQDYFHLIEVSIFLEDPVRYPHEFRLAYTTCRDYITRDTYPGEAKPGLTWWAIHNRESVLIWDLRYHRRFKEQELMTKQYKGLTWKDPNKIEEITSRLLQIPIESIPPLSFIAKPIFSGDDVRGVLRCCGVKTSPHYFTHRERDLFAVIASQIGQFWTKRLARRTIHEENKAWKKFVELTSLNDSVNLETRNPNPNIQSVLEKGVAATADIIPGAEIIDIRLADEAKKELYVAFTHGEDWTDAIRERRFPLAKDALQNLGVTVFHSGQVMELQNIQGSAFPRAKALLVVPIRSSTRNYGVIDIRSTDFPRFPEYAKQMAKLLGQQLGLYHELIDTVVGLRKAELQLIEQARITNDAFANWQHQIRGPIEQADFRLRESIRHDYPDYREIPQHLQFQTGLLRKARQASWSLQLFLQLTKGESLKIKQQFITTSELIKLLIETCLDNQLLTSKRRAIDFHVKTDSFKNLGGRLFADSGLLEQALNNVIDNAFKYSYSDTIIELQCIAEPQFSGISITNVGIPLSPLDVENVIKRGWRGEKALAVVGEGAGIGMWVVDHIMKAHGGRLEIIATLQRRTRVKLLFPSK